MRAVDRTGQPVLARSFTRDIGHAVGGDSWLCTNGMSLSVPDRVLTALARVLGLLHRCFGRRVQASTWIRYEVNLAQVGDRQDLGVAELSPVDEPVMAALATHAWREQPQLVTARRLWAAGLRRAFVWSDGGEPMCVQWLFSGEDRPQLQRLPHWSGMYPPLPPDHGQLENLVVLPKGMRRPGGSATPFTFAMYRMAQTRGMRRLVTHIHESNTGAHRWAERTGWTAYGTLIRYRVKLPLLQVRFVYLHMASPGRLATDARRPSPAVAAGNVPESGSKAT